MKTLTKAQELKQEEKRLALIEKNATVLFDIKHATELGNKYKAELDELNKSNQEIVDIQRRSCLADFNKLQTFLGKFKDMVELCDLDSAIKEGGFWFTIGKGANMITISYFFLREWWDDAGNFKEINGKNYPIYCAEDLEAFTEGIDIEHFTTLEDLFDEEFYSSRMQEMLAEHIIHSK